MAKLSGAAKNEPDLATRDSLLVALAGNPNSGKTSLFNALTGARQHVGNYAGVTVERREGRRYSHGVEMHILDLPGTYSLATTSEEERIAREVLLTEQPDVVVCVVDASNLERNLYLAVHLLELGLPVVIALNMVDVAWAAGIEIDTDRLSRLLRAPVVETVGRQGAGVDELLEAIRLRRAFICPEPFQVSYGIDLEPEIERIVGLITEAARDGASAGQGAATESTPPHGSDGTDGSDDYMIARREAISLLELDGERTNTRRRGYPAEVTTAQAEAHEAAQRIEARLGEPVDILIAQQRHGSAAGISRQVIRPSLERHRDITAMVDNVLVHRVLGLPIFLAAMYLVFLFTFTVADPMATAIEDGFAWVGARVTASWPGVEDSLLRSLVVDGVIGGVGGVLVFLPNIVLLFLAISLLEDSGYMARAAFLMDRLMRSVGLHGKSFIPMLLGLGCSVPAIMATRTIESRRARLTTMLVIPLMSCGARLPIYALIIPAFFPAAWHAPVLWIIYFVGVGLAMLIARLLRSTLFAGEGLPFVMELPPYRLPTVRSVTTHMIERAWMYLRKAGTVILAISIIMWALSTFPRLDPEPLAAEQTVAGAADENDLASRQLAHSYAGRLGLAMEPLIAPMGFDWKIGTALVGAFAAKEVFVAQMGIVSSVGAGEGSGQGGLRQTLRETYSPLVGLSVMLFCLIASPCMATLAVTRRESGSWGWAALQLVGLTVLAWVLVTAVFQTGRLLELGL